MVLQPGAGADGTTGGALELRDGSGSARFVVGGEGSVTASSAAGQDISLSSGADVSIQSSGTGGGETVVGSDQGPASLRVRADRVIAQAPAQLAGVRAPADARIAAQEGAGEVDEAAVLQQAMSAPVTSFTYSEEWRRLSGMGEGEVRAMIGQQVAEVMPDWVTVVDELSFAEQGFALNKFHEIDDRQVLYDTLLSLQAQHRRVTVGPHSATTSGNLDMTTADGGSYPGAATTGQGASGDITVATGSGTGGPSGRVIVQTGAAQSGPGGDVLVSVGTSGSGAGGQVYVAAGDAAGDSTGGSVVLQAGASERGPGGSVELKTSDSGASGSTVMRTGDADSGSSGGLTMQTGDSSAASAGSVTVAAGRSSTSVGAGVAMSAGATSSGLGGGVEVTTGAGVSGSGAMSLRSAASTEQGASGEVTVASGSSTGAGASGAVLVATGATSQGPSGSLTLESGDSSGSEVGTVRLAAGGSALGEGGEVQLSAGAGGAAGGSVLVDAGMGGTGSGGSVQLTAGDATAGSAAGKVRLWETTPAMNARAHTYSHAVVVLVLVLTLLPHGDRWACRQAPAGPTRQGAVPASKPALAVWPAETSTCEVAAHRSLSVAARWRWPAGRASPAVAMFVSGRPRKKRRARLAPST